MHQDQVSGEHLQDHWSSGNLNLEKKKKKIANLPTVSWVTANKLVYNAHEKSHTNQKIGSTPKKVSLPLEGVGGRKVHKMVEVWLHTTWADGINNSKVSAEYCN